MKNLVKYATIIALFGFGLITLILSSSVIFDWFGIRANDGNYVLFVVWANFISSIIYLLAGYGFLKHKKWTTQLLGASVIILIAAFIGLLFHINSGELYETKTVSAMIFRTAFTALFTMSSYFIISKNNKTTSLRYTLAIGVIFASFLFVSCNRNEGSTNTAEEKNVVEMNEINYLETGKELAMQTKASLGKNLISAINEKGSDGAVEFCSAKAIPITDSMSIALGAKIKRVSDKPRNSNNQANEAELAYINSWKEAKAHGEEHRPLLTELDGKMVGYYPIVTNQMCSQCHGTPKKQIDVSTLSKIRRLYPADSAIGYADGELRGVFVVEMNKNQTP
jgi:hypothetical protein